MKHENHGSHNPPSSRDETPQGPAPNHSAALQELLKKIAPYWPDLLHQGSVAKKFSQREESPYVLQFRQKVTGTRDGRQKRLYVGAKQIADELMEEIWRRREESGTRYRRGRGPRLKDKQPLEETLAKTIEILPAFKYSPLYPLLKRMAERDRELREENSRRTR